MIWWMLSEKNISEDQLDAPFSLGQSILVAGIGNRNQEEVYNNFFFFFSYFNQ